MNKRGEGEGEGLFLILLFVILIIISSAMSNTSYKDCSRDCKNINKDIFSYSSVCSNWYNVSIQYDCIRLNRTALNEYCFGKCNNEEETSEEKQDENS